MDMLNMNFPDDLESLSREELISILKNVKSKISKSSKKSEVVKKKYPPFDFNRYKKRHVALKFLYLGWDYSGFAAQIQSEKTIEEHLFNAMQKTKLLESREASNYHRCGRTDKGVSAFSQIISLDLRSNLQDGVGIITPENFVTDSKKDKEIDYPTVLNRVLPPEIRVIAWTPVQAEFSARPVDSDPPELSCEWSDDSQSFLGLENSRIVSNGFKDIHVFKDSGNFGSIDIHNIATSKFVQPAYFKYSFLRFDCVQRTYKYLFPIGNLDIKKMNEAGQRLIGEHDFRNFCKMDVANGVVNYKRKIFQVVIKKLCLSESEEYSIAELTVVGQAFLYHQIRCIVSVLCLIGIGKEDPQIIDDLLDIIKFPRKPQYNIASEIPLVLFDCSYDKLDWVYDAVCLKLVIRHLQNLWAEQSIKSVIIRKMLIELEKLPVLTEPVINQAEFLLPGIKPKVYKRLLERPCCESLEERIEKFSKKPRTKLRLVDSCKAAE